MIPYRRNNYFLHNASQQQRSQPKSLGGSKRIEGAKCLILGK